jgi:hypothetical protein
MMEVKLSEFKAVCRRLLGQTRRIRMMTEETAGSADPADRFSAATAVERAEKSIAWMDPDPEYSVNGGRFRTGKACGRR